MEPKVLTQGRPFCRSEGLPAVAYTRVHLMNNAITEIILQRPIGSEFNIHE